MAHFYVGTSGVVVSIPQSEYPENFKGKSRLAYYSSIFNSLEVNSSFYKNPMSSTVQRWVSEVPLDFRFTFKLSKQVSHAKNLQFEVSDVQKFFEMISYAGDKAHCILIQLPPSTTSKSSDALKHLLFTIKKFTTLNIAVEFRNESWYNEKTYKLLQKEHAAVVIHDYKKGNFSDQFEQPFYYFRFHGIENNYRGSYSKEMLARYTKHIRELLEKDKTVYCYFNNTMGNAFENAKQVMRSR